MSIQHSALGPISGGLPSTSGNHIIYHYTFLDEVDMLAGNDVNFGTVTFAASDVGRVARITDTDNFWILNDHVGPVFTQIDGGAGGGTPYSGSMGTVSALPGNTGSGDFYARGNHTHQASVDSATTITGRQPNASGSSNSLALADHVHTIAFQIANVSTSPYSVLATDGALVVDTTTNKELSLPNPATVTGFIPFLVVDKDFNAANKPMTLARFGSEKIDGVAANKTLDISGGRWQVWTNGTDWFTLGASMGPATGSNLPVTVGSVATPAAVGTSEAYARADHRHTLGILSQSSIFEPVIRTWDTSVGAAGLNLCPGGILAPVDGLFISGIASVTGDGGAIDISAGVAAPGANVGGTLILNAGDRSDASGTFGNIKVGRDFSTEILIGREGVGSAITLEGPTQISGTLTMTGTGTITGSNVFGPQVSFTSRSNSPGTSGSFARADHVHDTGRVSITFVTGNYSVLSTDQYLIVSMSGPVTMSLPSLTENRDFSIKKVDSGSNTIYLQPQASQRVGYTTTGTLQPLTGSSLVNGPAYTMIYHASQSTWWVL